MVDSSGNGGGEEEGQRELTTTLLNRRRLVTDDRGSRPGANDDCPLRFLRCCGLKHKCFEALFLDDRVR